MAQRLILAGAVFIASVPVQAQALNDPMRPPAVSSERETPAAGSSRLQSVLISPTRSIAVIDGRAVKLGEQVGDAKLVAISPSEVILQRGAERETLRLHPGIAKRPVP
jgi:MSHA biogenesis protein MshK